MRHDASVSTNYYTRSGSPQPMRRNIRTNFPAANGNVSLSRALSSNPEFLICDELTSVLDVSVQSQILNLMKDLQRRLGLTYLFISHNLAVVYHVSERIGVMYLGRLCEITTARALFAKPQHPYTRLLLDTIPNLEMTGWEQIRVAGEVPNPIDPPSGCAFHPRCPFAEARYLQEAPALKQTKSGLAACHAVEEGRIPAADAITPSTLEGGADATGQTIIHR